MASTNQASKRVGEHPFLRWINLRSGEGNRTFWMFAFYTFTSTGLMWLEACSVEMFLAQFGAANLPLIYIVSAVIKIGLGWLYSELQRYLPLRMVIVAIALLLASPLPIFSLGLSGAFGNTVGQFYALQVTVFAMQLWLEASHVLNDLNASITANQLFNIREIKRTYPLISSGILVADVVGGFSLPFVLGLFARDTAVSQVLLIAFAFMVVGVIILCSLSHTYQQSFPEGRRKREEPIAEHSTTRLRGQTRRYMRLLQIFFALAQVFLLLVEFQFLTQLGRHSGASVQLGGGEVAGFLGIFNGSLGICELAMQWLFSSRILDRMGVFRSLMLLPMIVIAFTGVSIAGMSSVFLSVLAMRFFYELLHYTLLSGSVPFLFYSVPDHLRNREQAKVRGIAEPISTAITGLVLLGLGRVGANGIGVAEQNLNLGLMILFALGWLATIVLLKKEYLNLLVLNAGRGQLSTSDVDMKALRQKTIETLENPGADEDKRACIEFLSQIDGKNAAEVLAPLLLKLTPELQHRSIEVMLNHPNPAFLNPVKSLCSQRPEPEVMAVALEYIWTTGETTAFSELRHYLKPNQPSIVRATAASLILRQGTMSEKAEATYVLQALLTHKQMQERVIGCRALGGVVHLQGLRLWLKPYIPRLLKDPSIEVKSATLEAIAATRSEEFYRYLLSGLYCRPTRPAAKSALVRLGDEALPRLIRLADDVERPPLVRSEAFSAIGQIGTPEAIDLLISRLVTSWGTTRRLLLRILLKVPNERGIEAVAERLGRAGIEELIEQELMFMGQIYAALMDLIEDRVRCEETKLLRAALEILPKDSIERLFLLMKFLYPIGSIRVAEFNFQSDSRAAIAQGLEILDSTLDIASKRALLGVLDRELPMDKLQSLSSLVPYTPMQPDARLNHLLELRHFISDWALACCFHLSRRARWKNLNPDAIRSGLRHPRGYVREAVLSYVAEQYPQQLGRVLQGFQNERDPIVAKQVKQMMQESEIILPEEISRVVPRHPNLRVI
ncbi:HEAT repeat domain-containing protein [Leptolyngbya sp. FACHB-17]|uniref:HEAT repeat domain-containing protein n=1 Tax=unclassified Leptolyngbya TaxID=2650499 RepID=UPI0016805592|nr:HEAT repeat domain-containing protein [Leptolyngbya sp. FACHB-17]MBD2082424.1 HEAT repeat domain-containing protein [Leptolyngbya sp. FACHB-17]